MRHETYVQVVGNGEAYFAVCKTCGWMGPNRRTSDYGKTAEAYALAWDGHGHEIDNMPFLGGLLRERA